MAGHRDVTGLEGKGPQRWYLDVRLLRWVAIVLPVVFLAALDALWHTLFPGQASSLPALIGRYVVISGAVVLFSYAMFGLIGRLQRRISDQNRQLSALNDIIRTAASKLKLEDLLDASLDHILSNTKADAGLICLVDMEKEEHSAVWYRGFSPELVGRIQRAKLGDDPVASEVVRTGRPVVLERVFEHPRVGEAARQEGIRSAFSAPLMSEGEVNGILAIATRRDHHFSKADEEFIEAVGGQLGMAIKNAFLYDHSERQNRELSALITVGKVATSTFDLQDLLTLSLDTVLGVTTADAAEVWLIEQDDELIMRCTRGSYSEAFLEVPRFKVGEGVPGIVAQSGEPVVIADLPSDPSFVRRQVVEAGFHCFCAIPLRYRNRTVGVLTTAALSSEAVGKQDLRLLEGIGEWLALAIENARLYKDVQDAAVIQERERIAREMHDGMAQLLGYINTQTLAVKKRLANEDVAEAREELTKMGDVARDLYADVREGILGLRTVATRQAGFLATIREYAQRYSEMCGIEVEINGVASGLPLLEPSTEIQLIRIIQEALANVRKHSRATRASVELDGSGNDLQVTIADNGRGFDLARLPGIGWPRFGLQSMRERAEAIGGSLNIGTAPGQGTRVTVRVPVLERKSSEHESPAR